MKMTRKKAILIVLASVATGTAVVLAIAPIQQINKSSLEQVKEGMSKQEVERLFRVPPGIYCDGSIWLNIGPFTDQGTDTYETAEDLIKSVDGVGTPANKDFGEDAASSCYWISTTGACWIVFDADERVLYWETYEVEPRTLWDRVKAWIASLRS